MVGVIILYDYVHPVGAFAKSSKIDVSTAVFTPPLQFTACSTANSLFLVHRWKAASKFSRISLRTASKAFSTLSGEITLRSNCVFSLQLSTCCDCSSPGVVFIEKETAAHAVTWTISVPVHETPTDLSVYFAFLQRSDSLSTGDLISCEPSLLDLCWVSKPLQKGWLQLTPRPLTDSQFLPGSPNAHSCWSRHRAFLWWPHICICLCSWAWGRVSLPGYMRSSAWLLLMWHSLQCWIVHKYIYSFTSVSIITYISYIM